MAVKRIEPNIADRSLSTTVANNYKDFDRNFDHKRGTLFPDGERRGDLYKKEDVKSIDQSIEAILTTNNLEKPFLPDFGSDLRKLLFELNTMVSEPYFRDTIIKSIEVYEPRVEVLDVSIYDLGQQEQVPRGVDNIFFYSAGVDADRYSLLVTVYCRIRNTGQTIETAVNMNRIR